VSESVFVNRFLNTQAFKTHDVNRQKRKHFQKGTTDCSGPKVSYVRSNWSIVTYGGNLQETTPQEVDELYPATSMTTYFVLGYTIDLAKLIVVDLADLNSNDHAIVHSNRASSARLYHANSGKTHNRSRLVRSSVV